MDELNVELNNKLNEEKFIGTLPMYTREEVAEFFCCHKDYVTMISDVGCLKAIKMGKRFMYSYEAIKQFQKEYEGMDLSNRVKATKAFSEVQKKEGMKE